MNERVSPVFPPSPWPAQAKQAARQTTVKSWLEGMMYLFPSLLLFGIFLFYPLARTLYLSVFHTDYQGKPTEFAGLAHFAALFQDETFWHSVKTTFLFAALTVPATIVISFGLALLVHEKRKGIGIFRTFFASTMGMSVAAASVIWMFMYNPAIGIINRLLSTTGLASVSWLLDPDTALYAVAIATIWMNIGFTFLLLLAGLQNIDPSLYESARIAGFSYWRQLWTVTVPLLSPTLFFVTTVSLIQALQTFGQIDFLTKGGPVDATNVFVYAIYREAFVNYQFGFASAQAIVLFLIIAVITFLQFRFAERKVHYQ
ncbi:glycerol-3-phosphate ABC transporter permease [Geobacillus sp. 46C-IIa]|uniref:carbohydrate ABC transporter permease n=1 Tax=Geobacillus sp. 46C-IIa TaxID=1963025 RepID=UPI0009BD7F17|nr:sugar ABC transporter permease [Geobacillus sp. 46C-IIa]OQP04288.1 glycerol-3-phosphate ABC transporter permease [Geobacillus sp. 46C-IIa]QNU29232.1 sugar ABC transporter permease [Geobacillus sp. 46C-IIa]